MAFLTANRVPVETGAVRAITPALPTGFHTLANGICLMRSDARSCCAEVGGAEDSAAALVPAVYGLAWTANIAPCGSMA